MMAYDDLGSIIYKKQCTARKSHICEVCGCEIHSGELIWWYKPKPEYNKITKSKTYSGWRKRCVDHEPRSYAELDVIYSMEARIGLY